MARVVILGSGFAGIFAAKKLIGSGNEIVMVSHTDHFLFTPLLHEAAAGEINLEHIAIPVRRIIAGKEFSFIKSKVAKVDLEAKEINFGNSKMRYDFLIIAIGSKINYYGIKGAEEFTFNLKTREGVRELKDHIHDCLEKTASASKSEIRKLLTFAIVGAGPTGIEFSGDLSDLLNKEKRKYSALRNYRPNIMIFNSSAEIMPLMDKASRKRITARLSKKGITIKNNSPVTDVGQGYLIAGGKKIRSGTIIWSAGVRPNELEIKPWIQDEKGYIKINSYLNPERYPDVFAIGDIAYLEGVPQLAQAAKSAGIAAAENILRRQRKQMMKKFVFSTKGILVSLGKFYAVGELFLFKKRYIMSGIIPRVLKRAVYLFNLPLLKNKLDVLHDWFLNSFN